MRHWILLPAYVIGLSLLFFTVVVANDSVSTDERMDYFLKFENESVPWYHLAAIDQFERNIQQVRNDIPKSEGIIAIQFAEEFWAGAMNPNKNDTAPESITFFEGNGLDGDNDGKADPTNNDDILYTMMSFLNGYGPNEDNFKLALWDYYKRQETVNQIVAIAQLYKHFETMELDAHAFPIPKQHNYSYRGTWGANRGWGGRRIHEGTDLFAGHGVPVLATSYGVIEIMGWNEYGGWRVGIRDNHNTYHYFAHLAYFNKGLKEGDIVEPGTIIGYVGSSGYGKEGTSGRFPPHLHYGMYKYNGRTEWAFDPFPSLRLWERQ
ncbi:M23 family metallopeptidase [Filibacter tadaridae]|uniref:L-Ala--D-Glu endopeptidase n=1 Tax=Filibacter tadaridae TaxID=2483811 RepID=A0A3P5X2D5_9BACL|nr:M23 family metallopeptidase [Filibacter tadaridae]VDC28094.1 L-Ala--D-Glu endopeptidase precursor [Filibacter tadaridae]